MKKEDRKDTPPKRRVTHRDIAEELGVSQVTVSLALRNHPRISEATRARVQAKAVEMEYHPDPMLSALANYRLSNQKKSATSTLAWINPLPNPEELRAQHEFDLYWKGAALAAERLGFRLEEFATRKLSLKRMDTVFKTRNIKGIIIAPVTEAHRTADWHTFPWQEYCTVRFGLSTAYPEVHHVGSAQVRNTILAVEQMAAKGYRRIGFYGEHSPSRIFYAGAAFARYSIPDAQQISPLFYRENDAPEKRISRLEKWLSKEKPDAILTGRPQLLGKLQSLGYRIPGDIGLATLSVHDTPIDAGIDQKPEEIGRAAVRTVVSLINEQSTGIPATQNEILIEGQWVDGSMLPACET